MTRKRFVKLLMANGWSRNGANDMAEIARAKGVSYETAINDASYIIPTAEKIVDALRCVAEEVGKQILQIADAMGYAISAACEAFNQKMKDLKGEG